MSTLERYPGPPVWVEHENNPAPQVSVHSAPEAVYIPMHHLGTGNDGAGDVGRTMSDGGLAAHNEANESSQPTPNRRPRFWNWKTITGLCFGLLLLVGLVPAITITTMASNEQNQNNTVTNNTSLTLSTSSASPTSASSPKTTSPSSTLSPARECVKSKFLHTVNWIGIDESLGGWDFNLTQANTAQECCTMCYQSTPRGCNGWLYMPSSSSTPPCSIILGFTGPSKGDACPNGRPGIIFAKREDQMDNYGGPGPCAGSVRE